ncbi:hypothetical protein A3E47_00200 [Candidatus Peribacteria bacterium RIFCSPHIGHO2_12_FULL_54_10]|nr:MAG: hypothetical protein A3E47_00200 [Candidatus Peribacteria bacterium RIFCSPHIGHO2_12_FULL_54_10]
MGTSCFAEECTIAVSKATFIAIRTFYTYVFTAYISRSADQIFVRTAIALIIAYIRDVAAFFYIYIYIYIYIVCIESERGQKKSTNEYDPPCPAHAHM